MTSTRRESIQLMYQLSNADKCGEGSKNLEMFLTSYVYAPNEGTNAWAPGK